MIQLLPKLITFDEFIEWLPENRHYELHEGIIIEMQPTGQHEDITSFLTQELTLEYMRMNLPYRIPPKALVKLKDKETGYNPDLLLINRQNLINEPLWEKKSTLINGESIPLVIEVVSSNWRDDYGYKLVDYEAMGIKEYWIVDYLGIGGVRFIGQPKQPTLSIYQLIDGEYQGQRFRGKDLINKSLIFPELNLTAAQVFQGQK
ncbi:MAG: Uma2 family endonuclease [Microcystis viridis Mv_BB_P_19951000_S69]|jgi:Uma2 family endonuclease|uniref:Uma2 family endonuclease n=1 Tax=Microcystis viridis Mv_BB_P_19951000_S68D TaxID=2486270 RepID=A0A552IAA6_MICVR|nr:MAG: Uma2 family endonuclease [Microcystis viridis Mv_BB_P_19951000_S69]TRU73489.1 MAG: Uma2 family endonuclease [Microcystis viridis Mv_BB_P_19951000_S68]TRU80367.1 MAG: Uma2 family endonuclease [Microcystis viridis Mv_BB_P_19951000_S68D]TRU80843.1 MAG: Uma2 family endonuclease [Microcystis viridis Mv_BB_P_19951000_S69D]